MSKKNKVIEQVAETPVVAPQIRSFLIVGIKGNPTGMKIFIESVDAGKALLKDLFVAINKKKTYISEERAIVINAVDISHAFLTFEQVK
jgi:hypothetical protein